MTAVAARQTTAKASLENDGYCIIDAFQPDELDKVRALISSRYLEIIADIYPEQAAAFAAVPITEYHKLSSLVDHKQIWQKSMRLFDQRMVESILPMSLFANLKKVLGDYELFGDQDLDCPEIYWRITRPLAADDVGPIHADKWFLELGDGVLNEDDVLFKVWVPIHSDWNKNGLLGYPGSHHLESEIKYDHALRDGRIKPALSSESSVDVGPAKRLPAEPGKAVVFDYRFLHRGSVNEHYECRVSFEFTCVLKRPAPAKSTVDFQSYEYPTPEEGLSILQATDLRPEDRILPTQPVLKQLYRGPEDEFFSRLLRTCSLLDDGAQLFDHLKIELPAGLTYHQLGSDVSGLRLLRFLISSLGAKKALEIGSYVGVSAMLLADAMAGPGKVYTVEKCRRFADITERNIIRNKYFDRVELIRGEVLNVMPYLRDFAPFDFIYLDGDKGQYDLIFDALLPSLAPAGVIFVDDVLFHGDTLNDKALTSKGQGVVRLLERVRNDDSLLKALLPTGNGALLVRRK